MIRPTTVILADSVIHDQATNSMSLINIVEEVRTPGYPLLLTRLAVFCMFERDEGDEAVSSAHLAFSIGDEAIFESDFAVDFGQGRKSRAVLRFEGFVIPRPGLLRAAVSVGERTLESYGVEAFPAGTPTPVVEQGPA